MPVENERNGIEVLIVPLNDYVEFKQKYAYTWYKVVADFGGLL